MDGREAAALSDLLRRIKTSSGVEVSVYIPSSLRDREIADFSIQVAEAWKLGRRKEDKGLLFVIAPKERKMRIEVGYGLEGEITDAFSRRVLDNVMRPYFREGRYADGIAASLVAINEKLPLGLDSGAMPERPSAPKRKRGLIDSLSTFFWIVIVLIFVFSRLFGFLPLLGRRRYYGGWGGGGWGGGGSWRGGGGSSWGGGGGGFGGGGASSSW